MNIIILFVVGGVVGWVASKVISTDGRQGIFLNVVVGCVGALLGGWLLSPIVGGATINQGDVSVRGLFVSLLGAIALLAIMRFVTHRRAN
jgi:uncharacterized membrane protein YeaQ/YmgE (transglycosylase-associated protein family)